MYIFCDLYMHQHDIWNQVSYEIKEKCLHKSSGNPPNEIALGER